MKVRMIREQVYKLIEEHYKENFNRIVRRISRYLNNRHNAEDVVQEAYFRACKYWKSYESEKEFSHWFNIILNNAIKNFFKTNIMQGMGADITLDNTPHALKCIELKELLGLIENEDERVRRILTLYLVEGYTSVEVGEIVPESAINVRKIVQRFRNEIKNST